MRNGKWACSTQEEQWDCSEEFDTRDEAHAYAVSELAPEMGLDDGDNLWVGQIVEVTMDKLADHIIDADEIFDRTASWLYDNVGEDFADSLVVTKPQADDLEARIAATIREWAAAHAITPGCFQLEHVESFRWKQCGVSRPVAEDDVGITSERCALHDEHDGVCQWP